MDVFVMMLLLLLLYTIYGLCVIFRLGGKEAINLNRLNPIAILLWPILLILYLIDEWRG